MYPNPQDVLPLPPHPDTKNYRKRAKDLVKACKAGGDAIQVWASQWIQHIVAVLATTPLPARRDAEQQARRLGEFARDRLQKADCALSQAQYVIARVHGFPSWTQMVRHIESLRISSEASAFEAAADAIVTGDLSTVERLLAETPALVRIRSTRDHRATLLHYVSANGVENYRQRTPQNIVAITQRLLDAGAAIDAEADVYGGGATTLGLVVTSAHPRLAGVQLDLADLLIRRGARIPGGIVRSCLMNGCPEAAAHLAQLTSSLTLQEAAGIGRLDVVAQHFVPEVTVSAAEAATALIMASWYDRREIITFLLEHGVDVAARDPKDGHTALHNAAYRGNSPLVSLLLQHQAPVNVTDSVYHTPPLVWALHAWLVENREDADAYRRVIRQLADAGAEVKLEWLDDDRLRADQPLYQALASRAR